MKIRKICLEAPKNLTRDCTVCVWGADTFGGQVPDPFSSMIERNVGIPILNLGAQHSGAGFYIEDDDILKIIENAHII